MEHVYKSLALVRLMQDADVHLTACTPDDKVPGFESPSRSAAVRCASAGRNVCKAR